ncbi:MAG: carboxypeptidase-like regulatory domain-containing protein [Lacibacter sp.]
MLITYDDILNFVPVKVSGVVKDEETGGPVAKAHIYITKGEDEAFTNEKGEFVINTWQKFPVTFTVEHPSYKITTSLIADAQKQVIIYLKNK